MKSIIYTYSTKAALIIVFSMIASTFLFVKMDNEPLSMTLGFAGMLVGFSAIFLALESYKKSQEGILSFGDGLKIGAAIAVISALSYTVVWMIEFQFVFPDFMEKLSSSQIEQLKASNLEPTVLAEKIQKIKTMAEDYKNPFYRFGMTLMEILPIGLIITLLAAIILQKKRKNIT